MGWVRCDDVEEAKRTQHLLWVTEALSMDPSGTWGSKGV